MTPRQLYLHPAAVEEAEAASRWDPIGDAGHSESKSSGRILALSRAVDKC